jgi:hypothetical protein
MNTYKITLPRLEIKPTQVFYALKAIIHSILFQRTPNIRVQPKDVLCPMFENVSYTMIDHPTIVEMVEDKLSQLCVNVERKQMMSVVISLCHKVKKYGFLGEYIENTEWERWRIDIIITQSPVPESVSKAIEHIFHVDLLPLKMIPIELLAIEVVDTAEKDGTLLNMFKAVSGLARSY